MISANVIFPAEIISACLDYDVSFFINTGSILGKWTSCYSLTKSQAVDWMELYASKMKMVNLKLDHFYGPNDKNTKFVAMVLEKLLRNEPTIDLTDGFQERDFIYIDDVVDAFVTVIDHIELMKTGKVSTYEVGSGVKTSIRSLVMKLKDLTGSTSKLNFGAIPYRSHEMIDYEVDISGLQGLGWRPKTFIDEGLRKIITEGE
jgi:nucleoside-diphosphate-sugar epimerase